MVVAVPVVAVMEVPARPVVGMAAVRDGGVAATGAMDVRLGMHSAFVAGGAGLGVAVRDQQGMVVDVVAVLVVEVAVVQVVLVPVVQDLVVAAAVGVMMRMALVMLAGVHGENQGSIGLPDR